MGLLISNCSVIVVVKGLPSILLSVLLLRFGPLNPKVVFQLPRAVQCSIPAQPVGDLNSTGIDVHSVVHHADFPSSCTCKCTDCKGCMSCSEILARF